MNQVHPEACALCYPSGYPSQPAAIHLEWCPRHPNFPEYAARAHRRDGLRLAAAILALVPLAILILAYGR